MCLPTNANIREEEKKNYLNIKPENEMTTAEVDDFWNAEFRKIWNESNDKGQE